MMQECIELLNLSAFDHIGRVQSSFEQDDPTIKS